MRRLRALGCGLVLAFAAVAACAPQGTPCVKEDSTPAARIADDIDVAAVINDQLRLIEQTGLAPQRPGVIDLYFLGFAGSAAQDVFYNEVRGAQEVLDERFDTAGRALLLVNRKETAGELPFASLSALRAALDRLRVTMDPDEDILFLLLTSHGRPDSIAVDNPLVQLGNLSARDLRHALDRSGIRWRVVVLSACYSGSFIDELEDDRTLILTAARKDRPSFGCANGRRFTEFGKAFFGEALWREASFVAAFERARSAIAATESARRLLASEPQMYMGEAMAAKLVEFEQRLANP